MFLRSFCCVLFFYYSSFYYASRTQDAEVTKSLSGWACGTWLLPFKSWLVVFSAVWTFKYKMLLERGVMVGESIRLSPTWPRFEFRSDAIRLSLFFSASRPCSFSLFRLCFSGCSGIPLCIKLQSVRWRIVDEKKQCGVVLPQDH